MAYASNRNVSPLGLPLTTKLSLCLSAPVNGIRCLSMVSMRPVLFPRPDPFLIVLFNMRLHRASILSGSIALIIPNNHWAVGILTFRSSLNMMDSSVTDLLAVVPSYTYVAEPGRHPQDRARRHALLAGVSLHTLTHHTRP